MTPPRVVVRGQHNGRKFEVALPVIIDTDGRAVVTYDSIVALHGVIQQQIGATDHGARPQRARP